MSIHTLILNFEEKKKKKIRFNRIAKKVEFFSLFLDSNLVQNFEPVSGTTTLQKDSVSFDISNTAFLMIIMHP